TFLQAVTEHGTGAAAAQLHHPFGGKTGTTSDFTDAWFLGFSPSVTCGVWVGYDSRESLGNKETGAQSPLPIWLTFMKAAIVCMDSEQCPGAEDSNPMDQAMTTSPKPVKAATVSQVSRGGLAGRSALPAPRP